jgi:hypothetical protein
MAKKVEEGKGPEVPPEEVAARLKALGAELIEAADDAEKGQAKLHEIEDFLGNLRIKDYEQLAESPTVQKFVEMLGFQGVQPGQTLKRGTLAERSRDWTMEDVRRQFPTKTFEPRETITLTWNGLTIQLIDGQETTIPMPFWDLYQEHRQALVQAGIHERYLLGHSPQPPASGWMSDESARVRAWSTMAKADGTQGRGTLGVGPIQGGETPSEESIAPVSVTAEAKGG